MKKSALSGPMRVISTGVLVLAVAVGLTEVVPVAPAHAEVCETGPMGVVVCTDEPAPDPDPLPTDALEPPEPGEECFLEGDQVTCAADVTAPDPATLAPPDLISPFELAKLPQMQREALLRYQETAVTNVLRNHGLPDSDRRAVLTWGRAEAQAELLALVVEAIQTFPRTFYDQDEVVDWLTARVHGQIKAPAEQAVTEYVKWAGLDMSTYYTLLERGASEREMSAFLSQEPRPYSIPGDREGSTGGYCKYHPPAGYEGDYTGRTHQSCYFPCAFFCSPPMPTFDQFVRWGTAQTQDASMQSPDYVMNSAGIARAAAFGTVMATAVVGSTPIAIAATSALSAFGFGVMAAWTSWFYVLETGWVLMPMVAPAGTVAASSSALATAAVGLMAGVVATVLIALITAILVAMQVVDQALTPLRLAVLLANGRGRIDLREMIKDPGRSPLVYANFVDATVPTPRFEVCDNGRVPVEVYQKSTYQPAVLLPSRRPPYDKEIVSTTPCLNAVPPAAPGPDDPRFLVRPAGADPATARPGETITLETRLDGEPTGVHRVLRLSGRWFVHRYQSESGAGASPEVQTLKMTYTGWDGDEHWVRRIDGDRFLVVSAPVVEKKAEPDPNPNPHLCGYFIHCEPEPEPDVDPDLHLYVGPDAAPDINPDINPGTCTEDGTCSNGTEVDLDPATCEADRTCWTTTEIHYRDADGKKMIASIQ